MVLNHALAMATSLLASLPTQVSTTGQLLVDRHALHFENRTPGINFGSFDKASMKGQTGG